MGKSALELLAEMTKGQVVLNAPMAEHTTMRVGGPADVMVYPADRDDLSRLLAFLTEREIPYFLLGNGSNLIVRDSGVRGAVISLSEGFRELSRRDDTAGKAVVWAEAGLPLRRLVRWSVDQGISGFEELAGIPGTVGGALVMNAGAWGEEICNRVLQLETLLPSGQVQVLPRDQLEFAYRSLQLPEGAVITAALLSGEESEPEEVKTRVKELHRRRRESQPTQEPSAGSVFKNPPGQSAGQLVEECGLKGVRVGDAEVSRMHANFIINSGMATASQVVALIGMIQERVYVKHRVKLEPEVRIVGEWEKGKLRIQE